MQEVMKAMMRDKKIRRWYKKQDDTDDKSDKNDDKTRAYDRGADESNDKKQ